MRLGDVWRAFALCLTFATAAQAAEPEIERAVDYASQRGTQLFQLDQSAWVSTDELRRKVPRLEETGIAGWVVDRDGDSLRATYYRLEGAEPRAVFTADTRGNTVLTSRVYGKEDDSRLTPIQVRMAQALQVARRQPVERCTDGQMNSVVIPPSSADDLVTVYILSAMVKADEYPFGGHYRFDIDKNGKVAAQRNLSRSCLNMTRPPTADGGEPPIAIVTHLLDAAPTEIHVFNSISMGRPVVVGTPVSMPGSPDSFRMWLVNGPKITFVTLDADEPKN